MPKVHLLDYVAGNIRSLVNAIEKCGYEVEWIRSPEDVKTADVSVLLRETFARMVNSFANEGDDSES
jgi:glutamine amidotransferase/cyclase